MGAQATLTDPVSHLPTGNALKQVAAAPMDNFGRTLQVESGFRAEDALAGPAGTAGNIVSPLELGSTPQKLTIPQSAQKIRFRCERAIIVGVSATLNNYTVGARAAGQGWFPYFKDDGIVELPVSGMDVIYVVANGARCNFYFVFLANSNL